MFGVFREQFVKGAHGNVEFKLFRCRQIKLVAFGEKSAGGVPIAGAQVFLRHEQVEAAVPFAAQGGGLLNFGAMVFGGAGASAVGEGLRAIA